ncbi:hypothetical protein STSP2_03167 [Anaerohalosphaera lusitana]|uniref:Uncharacterized protein n=1 Tax=Anaerohalosphaera lusitana TaxID=1936003 RepID=A0A1U9NQA6_9BACT|nr:hypothetical protein [Anaerohalosphaera lusitana]AQT69967.1 hypothetical protein STSP2_03167 [Anaerohalosphaera lusitana]
MGQFLYFIAAGEKADTLCSRLRSMAEQGIEITRRKCKGPEGKDGSIHTAEPAKRAMYLENEQTWMPSACGEFHVGYYDDDPPGPADIQRPDAIGGHPVEMCGQKWLVPAIRLIDGGSALPQAMTFENGRVIAEPIPRYAELSSRVEKFFDEFVAAHSPDSDGVVGTWADPMGSLELIADAMSLNYYIGVNELAVLRAVTTHSMKEAMMAMIDWPTVKKAAEAEAKKKRTDENCDTADGVPG